MLLTTTCKNPLLSPLE